MSEELVFLSIDIVHDTHDGFTENVYEMILAPQRIVKAIANMFETNEEEEFTMKGCITRFEDISVKIGDHPKDLEAYNCLKKHGFPTKNYSIVKELTITLENSWRNKASCPRLAKIFEM